MRRGETAPSGLSCGREERQECKAGRAKVPRAAGAATEPSRALPEPCTRSSPCGGSPGVAPCPVPHRLRAETVLLGSVHVGHCPVPLPSPRLLERGHPVPSRSPPGWLETRARPAARRGTRPRGGEGDPSAPNRGSSRSPRPPCSEDAAGAPSAGASPGRGGSRPRRQGPRRQRPGGQAGDTRAPERGARPAGRSRPLPSQTFLQPDPSKGFSASTPHFDIPRLSQDPAS